VDQTQRDALGEIKSVIYALPYHVRLRLWVGKPSARTSFTLRAKARGRATTACQPAMVRMQLPSLSNVVNASRSPSPHISPLYCICICICICIYREEKAKVPLGPQRRGMDAIPRPPITHPRCSNAVRMMAAGVSIAHWLTNAPDRDRPIGYFAPLSFPFQRYYYWLGFNNAPTVAIHSALRALHVLTVWGLQDLFFEKKWLIGCATRSLGRGRSSRSMTPDCSSRRIGRTA
jgi:hypothetical protein